MNRFLLSIVLGIVAMLPTGVALAQTSSELPPIIVRFDKDGDEKISPEEAPPRMKERFSEIDTNGDQYIDVDEVKAERERQSNSR